MDAVTLDPSRMQDATILATSTDNMIHVTAQSDLDLIMITPQELYPDYPALLPLSRFNEGRFDLIVADGVLRIMEIIVLTLFCGIISSFGIVANIINIIVFFRQGALGSSSTVSLLALAFADIGSLIPVFCNSINYAIFLLDHTKKVMVFLSPQDFTEVFILWPHIMFVQISSWITVYIAMERCLCVVFPLKVRLLFTAHRSLAIVASIAMVVTLSFVPIYATTRVESMFDEDTNSTKLIYMLNQLQFDVIDVSNVLQSIVLRVLAVTTVFICTQITVYRVRLSMGWRNSIGNITAPPNLKGHAVKRESGTSNTIPESVETPTDQNSRNSIPRQSRGSNTTEEINSRKSVVVMNGANPGPASSSKERRLIRIITVISSIFVVCNTPEVVGIFTLLALQTFKGISPWDNTIHFIMYVQFFFESINAAVNIIVYYNMSTRYRQEFRAFFKLD